MPFEGSFYLFSLCFTAGTFVFSSWNGATILGVSTNSRRSSRLCAARRVYRRTIFTISLFATIDGHWTWLLFPRRRSDFRRHLVQGNTNALISVMVPSISPIAMQGPSE
ncbi:hypothetical protein EV421DRAFT_126688 [Armillaria borealis]|uniref:Uncharacterized protein n=1 Tax=Armillaria borealis TaxID=47425 RepID=A0AA39IWT6_9AGAR|nr:hypothetical protein EV421DRAFT_126688 [Armillaria borealis]